MSEDDDLSKQIQGRFDTDSTGDATEDTSESTGSTGSASTEESSTRSMTQYSMYLPEELQRELNTLYQRINLQRLENDKSEIEKNRHFNRAVIETALEHDEEIRERVEELTE